MNADWKEVARAMRDNGLKQREIAEQLGRNLETVRRALMTEERREQIRDELRGGLRVDPHMMSDAEFYRPHVPRLIRKLPGDPLLAARRFAAGEIDRSQLSQALRGEA